MVPFLILLFLLLLILIFLLSLTILLFHRFHLLLVEYLLLFLLFPVLFLGWGGFGQGIGVKGFGFPWSILPLLHHLMPNMKTHQFIPEQVHSKLGSTMRQDNHLSPSFKNPPTLHQGLEHFLHELLLTKQAIQRPLINNKIITIVSKCLHTPDIQTEVVHGDTFPSILYSVLDDLLAEVDAGELTALCGGEALLQSGAQMLV